MFLGCTKSNYFASAKKRKNILLEHMFHPPKATPIKMKIANKMRIFFQAAKWNPRVPVPARHFYLELTAVQLLSEGLTDRYYALELAWVKYSFSKQPVHVPCPTEKNSNGSN